MTKKKINIYVQKQRQIKSCKRNFKTIYSRKVRVALKKMNKKNKKKKGRSISSMRKKHYLSGLNLSTMTTKKNKRFLRKSVPYKNKVQK